ncbi:PA0069 family radical SAM protein [Candidatus Laterigemmans baculatus]|uniref:PA0069 family radical SAM protein n=1 Tax=Candidatus Laterigemmans baculatus TaxID=2770505 RepID=UPI0021BC5BCD|nr:PA0069 family radical SAM protein [Candidatus Laterigemmans baculatus]
MSNKPAIGQPADGQPADGQPAGGQPAGGQPAGGRRSEGNRGAGGRGARADVPNRFEQLHRQPDLSELGEEDAQERLAARPPTLFLSDRSVSLISENRSPDIPFRYSLNPYRGCEHGCSYCYARPTHEYLGMSAGLDFETKILVKEQAVRLLLEELAKPSWEPAPLTLSGVTDPYQPAERQWRLTRGLLQALCDCRHPVSLITKNALIERDLDLLAAMAEDSLVHAAISLTTLDAQLARDMEPRTSTPEARLRAIRSLTEAGVPVRVMVAPIVPGLTDHELPSLLEAAAEAGACCAGYTLLRLPGAVEPVFREWLAEVRPEAHDRVLAKIREARGGALNDATFGRRMRGSGERAAQIGNLFKLFSRQYGLADEPPPQRTDLFVRPSRPGRDRSPADGGQLRLF